MVTMTLSNQEVSLSHSLRVAYVVQGQHNHRPYLEIFEDLGNMKLEQQIDFLYAAFQVANPDMAKELWTRKVFLDWVLDNMDLGELMAIMKELIQQMTGKTAPADPQMEVTLPS